MASDPIDAPTNPGRLEIPQQPPLAGATPEPSDNDHSDIRRLDRFEGGYDPVEHC